MKIGGERLQGSIPIARGLDRLLPDPPLLPDDAEAREAVREAEKFAHDEMQHPIRQIIWWVMKNDQEAMKSFLEGSKIGLPPGLAVKTGGPLVAMAVRYNQADDDHVRADLAALPAQLDRADALIEAGTIGGETPNAADFQLLPGIRLTLTMQDLRPFIDDRPVGEAARALVPNYPGDVPPGLPDEWLAPLRESATAPA